MRIIISVLIALILAIPIGSLSQIGRTYPDGHGGRIYMPLGDISFADTVIYYNPGNPEPAEDNSYPQKAIGIPTYEGAKTSEKYRKDYVSLGHGGELIVKFTDNILYDIEGYDLYIFEVGMKEAFDLYISKNGIDWISLGVYGGGTTKVDIAKFVRKNDVFRYVKLVDLKTYSGKWPGADIDAIGAIGSAMNLRLIGHMEMMFDTGEFQLYGDNTELIDISKVIKKLNGKVTIEGYTDNVGKRRHNVILSQKRANTIEDYLVDSCSINRRFIKNYALGEDNPISDNNTEVGRQQNRRVEIIAFQQTGITSDITGTWKTNFGGELHLYRYGNIISGWYDIDYGEISGVLIDEHTIEAVWVEDISKVRCKKDLYGRRNMGKVLFKFNNDFTEFTATWGYCSSKPKKKGWRGKRK